MVFKSIMGAGVIAFLVYRKHGKTMRVIALGRERGGRYRGQFSLFCGGRRPGESPVETARRELGEEAGSRVAGSVRLDPGRSLMMGTTTIFVAELPRGTSRRDFIPNSEMSEFQYFELDLFPSNYRSRDPIVIADIDGVMRTVSYFATQTVSKARALRLL